jgi:hypothetical protein
MTTCTTQLMTTIKHLNLLLEQDEYKNWKEDKLGHVYCIGVLLFSTIFSGSAVKRAMAMASSFTRFRDHTKQSTTVGRSPLDEWSARRRDLYLTTPNTQDTLQTNIHAPCGIRTHDRSRRTAVDLRLSPRGHWDRHIGVSPRHNSLCRIASHIYLTLLHIDCCHHTLSVTRSKQTSCYYCETVKKAAVYFSDMLQNICQNIRVRISRIPKCGHQLILNLVFAYFVG